MPVIRRIFARGR